MVTVASLRTVRWSRGSVVLVDQSKLPERLAFKSCRTYRDVANAIRDMTIRGAPAIGVAAAMGMALAAHRSKAKTMDGLVRELRVAAAALRNTRPTARNLFWAIERMVRKAESTHGDIQSLKMEMMREASTIADEDLKANRRMGEYGASVLNDGDVVLTHCNTGTFATVSYGTALAAVRTAVKQGKRIKVITTETRPRLQGARINAFELVHDGIPVTLITDGMVGLVMAQGLVDKVLVGADRITRNGVINKIGTYTIAIAAKENKVPFYVVAPKSTFDLAVRSEDVTIELRDPREVTHIQGRRIAPLGVSVYNPAFDITPLEYVTSIITDEGVISPSEIAKIEGAPAT